MTILKCYHFVCVTEMWSSNWNVIVSLKCEYIFEKWMPNLNWLSSFYIRQWTKFIKHIRKNLFLLLPYRKKLNHHISSIHLVCYINSDLTISQTQTVFNAKRWLGMDVWGIRRLGMAAGEIVYGWQILIFSHLNHSCSTLPFLSLRVIDIIIKHF